MTPMEPALLYPNQPPLSLTTKSAAPSAIIRPAAGSFTPMALALAPFSSRTEAMETLRVARATSALTASIRRRQI